MNRATTLNPLVYKIKQFGYKKVFSSAVFKSAKIITVSDFVKKQLEDEWGIDSKKIAVTYEGVDENIIQISKKINDKQIKKILRKFNIKSSFTAKQESSGFIFYVGNAHPHKNIEGLIKAFLEIKKRESEIQLVLSGNDHYFWQKLKKEVDSHFPARNASRIDAGGRGNDKGAKDVIFTGFITDEELVALYKSAKAFVMPSFEEGFGIPLLEAFACGCPVVSSNSGSLPEVGGDAPLYFDPKDTQDMIEKISRVLNTPSRHPERPSEGSHDLRKELIIKGEKRYKEFSWEKLAKKTLDIYQDF